MARAQVAASQVAGGGADFGQEPARTVGERWAELCQTRAHLVQRTQVIVQVEHPSRTGPASVEPRQPLCAPLRGAGALGTA